MAGGKAKLMKAMKVGLPALGISGGSAAVGYSSAHEKGKKKVRKLGNKAVNVIRGQQRLIQSLARQNKSLVSAVRRMHPGQRGA